MNILCIDDNRDITELLDRILTAKGNQITVCNDGKKGLELIRKDNSDVVLLDMAMPHFSGEDVINSMSGDELEKRNILIFTASSISDAKIREYEQKGIKGCIRKPVRVEELVNALKKFE